MEELIEERRNVDPHTLEVTGTLVEWVRTPKNYEGQYAVWGKIYGDTNKRFPDGAVIRTSLVAKEEDGIAVTLNSAYRLAGEEIGETQ